MRLKHLIVLLLMVGATQASMAQKARITQFTQANLTAEMQEYLDQATSDKDKKAEVANLMRDFGVRYGALDGSTQGRVTL